MSEDSHIDDARVVSLAQEFSVRHRRGEKPTIEEYATRYPELAAEIRELFPMLCMLEDLAPENPNSSPIAAAPEIGPLKRLGEYRIIRELGRGGMGVVYEAEQESLRRRVAIKVLPFHAFQDPLQRERFRVEAQASARLHHTNIVPVFGVGEDQGVHYFIMQFIRGQTLAEVLREVQRLRGDSRNQSGERSAAELIATGGAKSLFVEPMDDSVAREDANVDQAAEEPDGPSLEPHRPALSDSTTSIAKDPRAVYCRSIARIALQVAEGLAYAHNEGILHRDIKPSNLLLDLKGTVWITDFGLAKMEDSVDLTATDGLVGTLRYMAPERFKGKGDVRSDVYSLGVTVYELLTLRAAFLESSRAELLREVTEGGPPPPRRIDPAIPRDLETIVLKAMARDPKDRYPSASALAQELRRFLNFEPVKARRASVAEQLWRWCQRKPAVATLTGISLSLLVALAIGSMLYAVRLDAERNRTFERLVASKFQEGRAWRLSGEPGSRKRSLDALREAVTPATAFAVRNEIIGSLARVELVETARHEETASSWTTDSEVMRCARLDDDGGVQVFADASASKVIRTFPRGSRRVSHASHSPGGRRLAAYCDTRIWIVWDVDRDEILLECKTRRDSVKASFDATSSRFAHIDSDGKLTVREIPGGNILQSFEVISSPQGIAFDPAGHKLAAAGFAANEGLLAIYDLETGRLFRRLFHPSFVWAIAWHADGRRLAAACADFNVYVWDTVTESRLLRLKGHAAEATRVSFGDNGRLLASGGWDNRTLIWHTDTGKLLAEAAGDFIAFSSSDRRLGFSWRDYKGGVGAWRVEGGDACRVLHAPTTSKGPHISVSSDGRWLAAACQDLGVRIWCLEHPEESVQVAAGVVLCVCFHPDASALWIGTDEGLFRWPLRQASGTNDWTLGPSVKVLSGYTPSLTISADGRRAAMLSSDDKIIDLDLEAGGAVLSSYSHPDVTRCELSSSGRWLVSSTFHGEDVRVWNTGSHKLEKSIPVGTANGGISADERWLAVVNGPELAVFEVGTWKKRFRIPRDGAGIIGGPLAFSRDGNYLAFPKSFTVLSLVRVDDGEELARFEGPTGSEGIYDLSFSPDQSLLLSTAPQAVHVWELDWIRSHLGKMAIDWSSTASRQIPQRTERPRLRIESGGLPARGSLEITQGVAAGQLLDLQSQQILLEPNPEAFLSRAAVLERLGDWSAALADLDRALAASPLNPRVLILRASVLSRLARPEDAVKDCERAVALCCRAPASSPPDVHCKACPIFREALRVRARAQASLGLTSLDSALRAWKDLLTLDGDAPEACESFPWLWVLKRCERISAAVGDEDSAELALACAEKSLRAAPEDPLRLRDLGAVKLHLGRLQEAETLLKEACRRNDQAVSAALYLAMVRHRQGFPEEARKIFEAASATLRASPPPGGVLGASLERVHAFATSVLETPASSAQR